MISDARIDNRLLNLEMRRRQQRGRRFLQTFLIDDLENGLPLGVRCNDSVQLQSNLSTELTEEIFLHTELQGLFCLRERHERVGIRSTGKLSNIIKYLCRIREHRGSHQQRFRRNKIQAAHKRWLRQPGRRSMPRSDEAQFRLAEFL